MLLKTSKRLVALIKRYEQQKIYKKLNNNKIAIYYTCKNFQKNCLILGNGPSLINVLNGNYEYLASQNLIVVNGFSISEYYQKIQPSYYIITDPAFWARSFESKELQNKISSILDSILNKTTWSLILYVPHDGYNVFKDYFFRNTNIQVVPYATNSYYGPNKFTLYEKGVAMPHAQNVLIASIFIAMNIGYKEIILLGADHNWFENLVVDENNTVCLKDFQFYNSNTVLKPWIRANGSKYKMYEVLTDLTSMFRGYFDLREYADYKKVLVHNATENSFIDAFERVNFESYVNNQKIN